MKKLLFLAVIIAFTATDPAFSQNDSSIQKVFVTNWPVRNKNKSPRLQQTPASVPAPEVTVNVNLIELQNRIQDSLNKANQQKAAEENTNTGTGKTSNGDSKDFYLAVIIGAGLILAIVAIVAMRNNWFGYFTQRHSKDLKDIIDSVGNNGGKFAGLGVEFKLYRPNKRTVQLRNDTEVDAEGEDVRQRQN